MYFYCMRKFGWPMASLFLAPAEGWKGPAEDLWPYLNFLAPNNVFVSFWQSPLPAQKRF